MKAALLVVLATASAMTMFAADNNPAAVGTALDSSLPEDPSAAAFASSSSSRLMLAATGEMIDPAAQPSVAVIKTSNVRQETTLRPRPMRTWLALAAMQHSAATFDAWTTRRAVRSGARELNPLLRPVAGSNAIYPALQLVPIATDYLSWKMMTSRRPAVRKVWWLPQVLVTTGATVSGIINLGNQRPIMRP